MTVPVPDVIDFLAAIQPESPLAAIRAARPQAREHAQKSYLALFEPADLGDVARFERDAVACFVAGLHGSAPVAAFYAARLGETARGGSLAAVVAASIAPSSSGTLPEAARSVLGGRLSAAFAHAHMLVFHPRNADAAALQRLLDAGWSTTGIVTLSQLVAFLAFQIRVVEGLRTLAAALPSQPST